MIGAIHPGKKLHVTDNNSGASLVDTGSSYSIIPHSSHLPPTGPLLKSANGQNISCWGEQRRTVEFGGHRYTWVFLLADVQFHIIGVDFLQHFQLLVDMAANGLRLALPPHTVVATAPASAPVLRRPSSSSLPTVEALSPPSLPTVEALPPLPAPPLSASEAALIIEFANVLNTEGRLPPTTHGVEHHIITEGHPVTAKFCWLDNTKLAATKEEFH